MLGHRRGHNNNLVIAEYLRGFGQGHYSPGTKYAAYDWDWSGLKAVVREPAFLLADEPTGNPPPAVRHEGALAQIIMVRVK